MEFPINLNLFGIEINTHLVTEIAAFCRKSNGIFSLLVFPDKTALNQMILLG